MSKLQIPNDSLPFGIQRGRWKGMSRLGSRPRTIPESAGSPNDPLPAFAVHGYFMTVALQVVRICSMKVPVHSSTTRSLHKGFLPFRAGRSRCGPATDTSSGRQDEDSTAGGLGQMVPTLMELQSVPRLKEKRGHTSFVPTFSWA